jgi:hypothetical protein
MKLSAHFYLLNEDFSPEYAEANHNGKESGNNLKYQWEDELQVSDLKSVHIKRNDIFHLIGVLPNDQNFDYQIPNSFVVEMLANDQKIGYLAVSESILHDFSVEETENNQILKVYLKDYEPMSNPLPGVFIAAKEFPKELVF